MFEDRGASGNNRCRTGLNKAMDALAEGDTLVIWRLNRLGRSLSHLIELVNQIAAKGAHLKSLNDPIDTTSSGGLLVFHMMGALAQFERSLNSERTRAGMEEARRAGKNIGRPRALSEAEVRCARESITQGCEDAVTVAERLGVHPRTLSRAIKRL